MRAIILDDEKHCVAALMSMLSKYTEVEVVNSYQDPLRALKDIRKHDADVLFLDIEMPHLNGLEFLHYFDEYPWKVIFTTAYDDYALKAFKVHALDYLLKPIDKEDLLNAIEKCKVSGPDSIEEASKSVIRRDLKNRLSKIVVPTMDGLELIPIVKVLFLESESNYTRIHQTDGKVILVSKTLKYFEQSLQELGFMRIHHSFIVNLDKIQKYVKGDGGYITMENSLHIPVSRSRKDRLLAILSGG